jgi:threonine/homoserine/homoserine lactone efflux protein
MHKMLAIRLSAPGPWRKVALSCSTTTQRRTTMKTAAGSQFFDNTLYLLVIFIPTSLLLATALATATVAAFA